MKAILQRLNRLLNRPLRVVKIGYESGWLDSCPLSPGSCLLIVEPLEAKRELLKNDLSAVSCPLSPDSCTVVPKALRLQAEPVTLHFIKPELSVLAPPHLQMLGGLSPALFAVPQLPDSSTVAVECQAVTLSSLLNEHGMGSFQQHVCDVLDLGWQTDSLGESWQTFHRPNVVRACALPGEAPAVARRLRELGYAVHFASTAPGQVEMIGWPLSPVSCPLSPVPQIIHQIWLGSNPMPPAMAGWMESVRAAFPDWEIKLWTEEDLRALWPVGRCEELIFDRSVTVGLRADPVRWAILHQCGGVFLDTDFSVRRDFSDLLVPGCFHAAWEKPAQLGSAFLAGPAGHPFADFMLSRLAAVGTRTPDNKWDIVRMVGPGALTAAWSEYRRHNVALPLYTESPTSDLRRPSSDICGHHYPAAGLVALGRDYFYPYAWDDKKTNADNFRWEDFPKAVAAHHWCAGWVKEE